jgi:wyosine [tRNA(Phe)-imidazoG37] synthetase (radical SAM superfamily)
MQSYKATQLSGPHFRIERAGSGYLVLGENFRSWEPTLKEAAENRKELEFPGWRYPLLPGVGGRPSRPPGAVTYGPVTSRRLGRSLGVNLARPGRTACSFDCVYCEYPRPQCRDAYGEWPTPAGVGYALTRDLQGCGPLDSVTISGTGEPTMHPQFGAVADCVLDVTRRLRPTVPVRILTNGATAVRPEIRRALNRLDERIVTLDADAERIDRPDARSPLGNIVCGISLLRDVTLQSCFIDGAVSNIGEEVVGQWADLVGELRPARVQIFTMSRRSAACDVRPVSPSQLEEVACILRSRTGIDAQVFA